MLNCNQCNKSIMIKDMQLQNDKINMIIIRCDYCKKFFICKYCNNYNEQLLIRHKLKCGLINNKHKVKLPDDYEGEYLTWIIDPKIQQDNKIQQENILDVIELSNEFINGKNVLVYHLSNGLAFYQNEKNKFIFGYFK